MRSKARQLAEKTSDGANDVSIEERQEMHFKKLVDKHGERSLDHNIAVNEPSMVSTSSPTESP